MGIAPMTSIATNRIINARRCRFTAKWVRSVEKMLHIRQTILVITNSGMQPFMHSLKYESKVPIIDKIAGNEGLSDGPPCSRSVPFGEQ